MSGAVQLPPSDPPAEDVERVLERLRLARREMADAANVLRLLAVDHPTAPLTTHKGLRHWIETQVAEKRCEFWAVQIQHLEQRARSMGLRP